MSYRVYGTWLDPTTGIRHTASGVKEGTFSPKPSGWDTNLTCGKYVDAEPDQSGEAPTCLCCLGKRMPTIELRSVRG